MAKKPHYSEKKGDEDPIDNVIYKHLRPPAENARKARTIYLSDDNYLGAKKLIGSRINEYLDDCLHQLITSAKIINKEP